MPVWWPPVFSLPDLKIQHTKPVFEEVDTGSRVTKHLAWKAVGEKYTVLFSANLVPWAGSCSACARQPHRTAWAVVGAGCQEPSSSAGCAQELSRGCGSGAVFLRDWLLLRVSGAVPLRIPLGLYALFSSELCFWLALCRCNSLKTFPWGTVACKYICVTLKLTQAVQVINPIFFTGDCLFFSLLIVEEVH